MSKTIYRIDAGIDGTWLLYMDYGEHCRAVTVEEVSAMELADLLDDQFDVGGFQSQEIINEYCKYGNMYERIAQSLIESIGDEQATKALWVMAKQGGLPASKE